MGRWPAFNQPLPNELFSSWFARLARANLCEPYFFAAYHWPGSWIWNIDCDLGVRSQIIDDLSTFTSLPKVLVQATFLHSFIGRYLTGINKNGYNQEILSVNTRALIRRNFGQQICPYCLKEDGVPYFRKQWRLTAFTVCRRHEVKLLDRCSHCQASINPHLLPLGFDDLAFCWRCGSDYRLMPVHKVKSDAQILWFQDLLDQGLNEGWGLLNSDTKVSTPIFLDGIWRIVMPFLSRRKINRMLPLMSKFLNIELDIPLLNRKMSRLNTLDVDLRFQAISLASALIFKWPTVFLKFCSEFGLNQTSFFKTNGVAPYWLSCVLSWELNKKPYWVSDEEFVSAILFLYKQNIVISPGNVGEALGLNRSMYITPFRKRILSIFQEMQSKQKAALHLRKFFHY